MPVIRIQALRKEGVEIADILQDLSRAVADAFDIEAKQCWSCFTEICPGEYLEGGKIRGIGDDVRYSPLVTVSAYQGRSEEEIARALKGVAQAVVSRLELDRGDVFVEYHELRSGHVHTGGVVK